MSNSPNRDVSSLATNTFVEIVDALVDNFDVIDVLTTLSTRCVQLLEAAVAAGILLADDKKQLRVVGASSEQAGILELFQIQNCQGPCYDCFHNGKIIITDDLGKLNSWPQFSAESMSFGFNAVCAVPLRLREKILGCLNLFICEPVGLSQSEINLAQALADVASITVIQDQAARQAAIREDHLQHALASRVVIEQAKGMIADRGQLDMDTAFSRLRTFARNHNRGLTEVAEAIVTGTTPVETILRLKKR